LAARKDVAEPEALLIQSGEVRLRDLPRRFEIGDGRQAHIRQLSFGDTEAPVVSNNDEPGDLLVLEGTSDQNHQARVQKRVRNALHDQSELDFL
jgi:hypothetical protein